MNYQKIYNDIIERGKNRLIETYTEKHHIVPRCMGGPDDISNIVVLTPEEHYLCHLLLVKIYPNNIRLVKAAMFMISGNYGRRVNNKLYGWVRKQYSEYMKGPNNPAKVIGPRNKGKTGYTLNTNFSDDTKKKLYKKITGDKNPCFGLKPWNHPRATEITKALWKKADDCYNIWITNTTISYCSLYRAILNKPFHWKENGNEISPFMNMIIYFRNGWIPQQDIEWKEFIK